MIDTVYLGTTQFDVADKNKLQHQTTVNQETGELREKWFCTLPSFSANISQDYFLKVTASLPKILYGSSYYEVNEGDYDKSIKAIEKRLQNVGIVTDKGSVESFNLHRIDFCRNIETEHHLMDYLSLLSNYRISRRDKLEYRHETLTFYNGQQELSFYNKLREIKQDKKVNQEFKDKISGKPENILRVESRLKRFRVINKEFNKLETKLADVFNFNLCRDRLLQDIDRLIKNKGEQLELNFEDNSKLLEQVKQVHKRSAFLHFIGYKGLGKFMQEFRYDYSKILEFLLTHFGRSQAYKILRELKEMYNNTITTEQRNLLEEIKYKVALKGVA